VGGEPKMLQTTSDYTGQQIYYRSIQERETDLLTTYDYLWRWDTDWFWCSGAFGVQNPTIRRLWPKRWRRRDVYHHLIGLNHRTGFMDFVDRRKGRPPRGLDGLRRPPQGPAPARAGGPGRRDTRRAARGVPGLVRCRGRDAAGLA